MLMNVLSRKVSLLITFCYIGCPGFSGGQTPSASTWQNEVTIFFTVIDKKQSFVKEIQPQDLKVFEDGDSQPITGLRQITAGAVSIALLIDTSLSQERILGAQKVAATSFVESVIQTDHDQIAVATFTIDLHFEQQFTNDLGLLRVAIARAKIVAPPGYAGGRVVVGPPPRGSAAQIGSTAIWDAVVSTCNGWPFSSAAGGRRAIVLLTDGQDIASKTNLSQAVEYASRSGIAVYSIGMGDDRYDGVDKNALRRISESTGGRAFFPKKSSDLSAAFEEIGRTLRNYYVLTYNSSSRKHASGKLRLEIRNPNFKDVQLLYGQIVSH